MPANMSNERPIKNVQYCKLVDFLYKPKLCFSLNSLSDESFTLIPVETVLLFIFQTE